MSRTEVIVRNYNEDGSLEEEKTMTGYLAIGIVLKNENRNDEEGTNIQHFLTGDFSINASIVAMRGVSNLKKALKDAAFSLIVDKCRMVDGNGIHIPLEDEEDCDGNCENCERE